MIALWKGRENAMEVKKASEVAEEMERLAVGGGIDVEKFWEFAKALAKAAEIVAENFRRLSGWLSECLGGARKEERIKKYNTKTGLKPVKMTSQVMCRKPRFLVRKVIG